MTPRTEANETATFQRLSGALHRRARRLTNCPHDAADLAQDTALNLWQHRCRGGQVENIDAYAMTALSNAARSRWRVHHETEELHEDSAAILTDPLAGLQWREMRAALLRLPPAQARLMALIAEGETSPADLARITGVPLGTVMSRLARARARLRREIETGPPRLKTAGSSAWGAGGHAAADEPVGAR